MSVLVALSPNYDALFKGAARGDLDAGRSLYNSLPDDEAQPEVSEQDIMNLASLFVKYHAHEKLGLHLIHGHFDLPEANVLLGRNIEAPNGRWSKVTDIGDVDLDNVHGHIFVWTDNGFRAYEFQEGGMPDLSGIDPKFFVELVEYLVAHNLTTLLGLQVLMDCAGRNMWEFILPEGTIMLDPESIDGAVPTRITGWTFTHEDGKPRVCQANETHSSMTTGNHKVFNAGKPLPKLETVEDLKAALTEVGLLRTA